MSVKVNEGTPGHLEDLVYYRWEKDDLVSILHDNEYGNRILNALYSMWLERTINIITFAQDAMTKEFGGQLKKSFDPKKSSFKLNKKLTILHQQDESSNAPDLPHLAGLTTNAKPF